jgi:hypothetical protein
MRSQWDARRSIQRYVAEALGAGWEVALAADRGEFAYPFARVQPAGDVTRSGPALYAELSQPMSIQCYPQPQDTVVASESAAAEVLDALERAFSVGVGKGRPLRVPLYDYDGVPVEAQSYERDDRDFLQVTDFSARTLSDPEDARNIAVVADVRVRWRRAGRLPYGGTQLVESVKVAPS